MIVSFLEVAELELDEAFRYYEQEHAGLGFRFLTEVSLSINRLMEYPSSYQEFSLNTRRCLVATFPYGILYQHNQNEEKILVVAIAHQQRNPNYWVSRLLF